MLEVTEQRPMNNEYPNAWITNRHMLIVCSRVTEVPTGTLNTMWHICKPGTMVSLLLCISLDNCPCINWVHFFLGTVKTAWVAVVRILSWTLSLARNKNFHKNCVYLLLKLTVYCNQYYAKCTTSKVLHGWQLLEHYLLWIDFVMWCSSQSHVS